MSTMSLKLLSASKGQIGSLFKVNPLGLIHWVGKDGCQLKANIQIHDAMINIKHC
jgi:hypothetical protein